MSTTEGRGRPRLNDSAGSKKRRRYFIGGSDARIIIGTDEAALIRLWQEKRGEVEPEDLSNNLVVQLGLATEDLNRRGQYRTGDRRCAETPSPSGPSLDGGNARRPDRR